MPCCCHRNVLDWLNAISRILTTHVPIRSKIYSLLQQCPTRALSARIPGTRLVAWEGKRPLPSSDGFRAVDRRSSRWTRRLERPEFVPQGRRPPMSHRKSDPLAFCYWRAPVIVSWASHVSCVSANRLTRVRCVVLGWASWRVGPDSPMTKLCYGEFSIHPGR